MESLTELFCDVDDFCQAFLPVWKKQMLSSSFIQRRRENIEKLGTLLFKVVKWVRQGVRPCLAGHLAPANRPNLRSAARPAGSCHASQTPPRSVFDRPRRTG